MTTEPIGKEPPPLISPEDTTKIKAPQNEELTKTFLGMKMSESQFKQAWATLINDVSRAIQHEMQKAKDAIKELGKSFEENE